MRIPFFVVALLLAGVSFALPWSWTEVLGGVLVVLGLGSVPSGGFRPPVRGADGGAAVAGAIGGADLVGGCGAGAGAGTDGNGCGGF
ncbi:hypothetical protein RDMS_01885 [Deinococcus sp. RL]|uniref:hypothetical protein n=1 Tax=Deinococcus sp. RL TaxID=1489678 RepID=UPI0004D5FC12|nr:hypothetical protein [Deinococcus sp. RL]KEF35253.1 hypothetical protein RDMS_01885 [Deinococcus sp. RL]